jgi:DNA-binding transcriptional MerR regulator
MDTAPAPLLTISAFARAVGLAPSTLRYYDDAGLLQPAEVDPQTGYRYYTPDLERRALLIGRLRDVGAPVELMRAVLDGPADEAPSLLRAFATEAARTAEATAAAVEDVIGRLAGPARGEPARVEVDAGVLAAALRRTLPAAADEDGSPLATVLLELSEAGLDVVATDRYWLTCRTLAVTGPLPSSATRVVLTRKDAEDAAAWLARRDRVTVELAAGFLHLSAEETVTWEGAPDRFPAHRMLLDGQPEPRGRLDVGRVSLARALTGEDAARIAVGDDRVWVTGPGGGEGVRLAATTVGDPVTIHFASPLLAKVLDALAGDTVRLAYAAPDRAVRITSPEQVGVLVLAMPILAS